MFSFTVFVLWIHLLGIIVLSCSLLMQSVLLMPILYRSGEAPAATIRRYQFYAGKLNAFSRESIWVILITGIFNFINAGYATQFNFSHRYLLLFMTKMSLFFFIIILQGLFIYKWIPGYKAEMEIQQQAAERGNGSGNPAVKLRWHACLSLTFLATALLLALLLRSA